MAPGPRPTALGAPYNEVINPSFENGSYGYVLDLASYSVYNNEWGQVVWERSTDFAARRGSWSGHLKATNISGSPASVHPLIGVYYEVPAAEGDMYQLMMDVKVVQNPRQFNAYFQFLDKNGVELGGAVAPQAGWSGSWKTEAGVVLTNGGQPTYQGRLITLGTYNGVGGMPVGTVKLRVWPLSFQGHAGDTFDVYLDNVTAVRNARPITDDTFAANTLGNYTVLVGTGLSVSGGALRPTDTTAKLLYLTSAGAVSHFPRVTSKVVFGTTVANYEGSPAIRIQTDGRAGWAGYEGGFLKIFERAAGGSSTALASVAVTAPTAGQTFWISLTGYYDGTSDRYRAEWWTTDPALGGTPAHTVTVAMSTLASTNGRIGLYWAGVHASLTSAVDDLKMEYWTAAAGTAVAAALPATFTGHDAGFGWEGEEGASRSGTGTAFADPFLLHPIAQEMLDSIPPVFREDPDVRAILYAQGREAERQEAQLDDLLVQLDPAQATDEGLDWFETLLKTAVSPPGKTVSQRQGVIVNRMSRVAGEPAGSGWETAVSEVLGVLGVDWDYAEYVPSPQVNMIHNPKAVANSFGVMTWWGAGYSNIGATTNKSYGGDPRFFGEGLLVQNNVAGIPGGTAGESMDINTGVMSVSSNQDQWYAFRCEYKLASAVNYGIPYLQATFQNLSAVVRGTAILWSGTRNLDLDADGQYHVVEGWVKQPINGANDTRRLTLVFVFPVITTGATSGNLDITLGLFVCTPVPEAGTPVLPTYFDGDTKHYQWTNGASSPDDDTSQTRSAGSASTIQLRVPYFAFDPTTDPKMQAVRDLTASHLDMEVLYSEAI